MSDAKTLKRGWGPVGLPDRHHYYIGEPKTSMRGCLHLGLTVVCWITLAFGLEPGALRRELVLAKEAKEFSCLQMNDFYNFWKWCARFNTFSANFDILYFCIF